MRRLTISDNLAAKTRSRRGDAAKVIIITVCVFAMIMLLLCVGAGVYGYVLFQRNFGRVLVEAPADIQKITAEITDIEIPSQFTPVMGSAIFGMKTVNYAWNPEGRVVTTDSLQSTQGPLRPMLHLTEMPQEPSLVTDSDFELNDYLRKAAKNQYVESTQIEKEFTIRGRKCQFLFVTGRAKPGTFDNDEMLYDVADEEMLDEEAAATTDQPAETEDKPADATALTETPATPPTETESAVSAEPAQSTEPPLPPVRTVSGKFPGKSGITTINIRVPVDGTDEDILLKMIQSIK